MGHGAGVLDGQVRWLLVAGPVVVMVVHILQCATHVQHGIVCM